MPTNNFEEQISDYVNQCRKRSCDLFKSELPLLEASGNTVNLLGKEGLKGKLRTTTKTVLGIACGHKTMFYPPSCRSVNCKGKNEMMVNNIYTVCIKLMVAVKCSARFS